MSTQPERVDPMLSDFDEHAVTIAKRQYFQPGDDDLAGLFGRVAAWVASPEAEGERGGLEERFFDLMASKRFCPGGRVLAGAATNHGNVLNCFVQDGSPETVGTDAWVMHLATKLALVTKVGGGNGLCLDPLSPKRPYNARTGGLYLTISASHPDYAKVKSGTYMDLVHGKYVSKGYRYASFLEQDEVPDALPTVNVGDSVESIWQSASGAVSSVLTGDDLLLDLSGLRAEGTPVEGSGGSSSGPSSFAVEVFDNFALWASLGGAAYAGPIATLRYIFAPTLRVIRQGGTRRGAGMATMSVTHPDIQDFITCKDLEREEAEGDISTFNISVLVSDTFMEAAKKTRASGVQQNVPRNVLQDVAEHAWQTGEPGLIFIDRINAFNPMRGALGDIKATNPCFPADVRIATQRGLLTLGELYKTQEELVVASDRRVLTDGLGVTPRAAVPVFKTSEAEKVYRVTTKHGFEVRATANHKFLTPDGWKELAELSTGDTLFVQSAEGMWSDHYAFTHEVLSAHAELLATAGSNNRGDVTSRTGRKDVREKFGGMPERWSRDLGAFLGFMVGDGFVSEDKAGITFSESDYEELKDTIAQYKAWFGGSVQHHASCSQIRFGKVVIRYLAALGLGSEKAINKRVPESIFSAPREAVVGFLQGLFTADGTVNLSCSKKSCSIRLASSSETLLKDVQLLLSNFGLVSRLYQRREAGVRAMPDGKGGTQLYPHASQYELMLDKINRDLFAHKIGFLTRSKQQRVLDFIASKQRPSNTEPFETVVTEIVFEGIESVYDTTEPVAHSVVANGIVAHQCGEIPLFPGEPCDLGAINLAQYVETPDQGLSGFDWASFKDDTKTCIRFLDNVLDVNRFALEDNRSMSMKLRRLGLGIMGLADALIKMGLRYDAPEGRAAAKAMIDELREGATQASRELAGERGAFPLFNESDLDTPRRNVALLTVAPTGTTSMLMGVSSGVEPIFAPFIYRKIGDSYAALVSPLFREMLEQHPPHPDCTKNGAWNWDKVVEAVQNNHGSVQGIAFIPEAVQRVLVCAHDIAPDAHVLMQGTVQSAFDAGGERVANSISKTINMPNHATVQDVYDAYSQAFDTGCKGITVYRDGSRQFQVLSTKKSDGKKKAGVQAAQPQRSQTAPVQEAAEDPQRLPGEPLFDRPGRLVGFTDSVKLTTSSGERRSFYLTVNKQDDLPTEVFIQSGKGGEEIMADSEALGRLVSIALQYGVPAEAIVKTLRGINGGMYGSYQGRMVASKADLIAVALETAGVQSPALEKTSCPEGCGGTLVREEGCVKCYTCGYSKCG